MKELTKAEKRHAKEILKQGILRRHAQWQNELRDFIATHIPEGKNEFDRSMEITMKARKFYKEAMEMEDYYSNTYPDLGLATLYRDGHITEEEFTTLPDQTIATIKLMLS